MKKEIPETRKQIQEPNQPTRDSGNLDEAIKWVYKRYGTDLPGFFRDAYEDVERRHREAEKVAEGSATHGRLQS